MYAHSRKFSCIKVRILLVKNIMCFILMLLSAMCFICLLFGVNLWNRLDAQSIHEISNFNTMCTQHFLFHDSKMPQRPTRGNNQPPPPPEINSVAFQAAVSAAVTAALAQIHNGNNGGCNR